MGFPGNVLIHLHSTPLQLAFDRGLPALFLALDHGGVLADRGAWKSDSGHRDKSPRHMLGQQVRRRLFASSLVNYNFGAGIVALVFGG